MVRRRGCDDEIAPIFNVCSESVSYVSSSDRDYEISDANTNESKNGTSDNISKTGETYISSNLLQVTACDPGRNTPISVQNTEHKTNCTMK
jgi:hypothetical protein